MENIKFGRFNKRDIEWIVLKQKEENGRKLVLLLSKDVIAAEPFKKDGSKADWENSSIREWLNSSFYKKAFSSDREEIIQKSKVVAYEYSECQVFQGLDTDDRIFLLSAKEIEEEYSDFKLCTCHENLRNQCLIGTGCNYCRWMLRTIVKCKCEYNDGNENRDVNNVLCVNYDGKIDPDGCAVNVQEGIRPAMWVDLSKM